MSDASETPDGAFEAEQSEAEQQDTQLPEGWEGEWNPDRAKATIERLRGREKELSAIEKQWNALQNDDQAFQEFVTQRGFTFEDDEPEEDAWGPDTQEFADEVNPLDERLSKAEQFIQQQEAERELGAVNAHVNELAQSAGIELSDVERDSLLRAAYAEGTPYKNLTEKAFQTHLAWRKDFEEKVKKDYLKSKRAPAPPQPGVAGEEAPDPRDHKGRKARIAARLAAMED